MGIFKKLLGIKEKNENESIKLVLSLANNLHEKTSTLISYCREVGFENELPQDTHIIGQYDSIVTEWENFLSSSYKLRKDYSESPEKEIAEIIEPYLRKQESRDGIKKSNNNMTVGVIISNLEMMEKDLKDIVNQTSSIKIPENKNDS